MTVATQPILLSGYDAKRCARRVHNEWDATVVDRVEWEVPAALQMRFDEGVVFEAEVVAQINDAAEPGSWIDLSEAPGKTVRVAQTVAVMEDGVPLILGGELPDDVAGGRKGRPDILLHVGDGRYVPGDVKGPQGCRRQGQGRFRSRLFNA